MCCVTLSGQRSAWTNHFVRAGCQRFLGPGSARFLNTNRARGTVDRCAIRFWHCHGLPRRSFALMAVWIAILDVLVKTSSFANTCLGLITHGRINSSFLVNRHTDHIHWPSLKVRCCGRAVHGDGKT